MAENLLITYRMRTDTGSGPTEVEENHYIEVYWDDVALALVTYELDENRENPVVMTSGPDLLYNGYYFWIGQTRADRESADITYKFCTGANLTTFKKVDVFPYARKIVTINHFSCASVVCDLVISDVYTIINATDSDTNDGVISVTATSSNGAIKYSLIPDFDPTTEGQGTGLFENLYPGDYTITAKDEIGCVTRKTLTVGIPTFYNIKYRCQYFDANGISSRVDILQRGYEGDVIDVVGAASPFILSYKSGATDNNKFKAVIPSQAQINLISETNFFYKDLFTQDDRKYLVKFYKNFNNTIQSELAALLDFENDGLSTQTAWTLGTEPTVVLAPSSQSKKLLGRFLNTQAGQTYSFDYDIDVLAEVGVLPLPALSTYVNDTLPVSKNWTLGAAPIVTSPNETSSLLSCPYFFTYLKSYTFYYDIEVNISIAPNVLVYFVLCDDVDGLVDAQRVIVTLTNGRHTGYVTMNANLPSGRFGIFASTQGFYPYEVVVHELSLPPDVVSLDVRISLLDSLKNTINSYTRSISANGNYTGSIDLDSDDSIPTYLAFDAINGDGNRLDIDVNVIINTNGPNLIGYEPRWNGYVIPQNYTEQYLAPPYGISITATDGLSDLKTVNLVDSSGNKLIDDITLIEVLTKCLVKTDLGLDIIGGINRFESSMDTNLDPLSQVRVNPKIFYNDKDSNCLTSLEECLKSFGARILQYKGAWVVYCIEEALHEFNTRVMDSEGTLKSLSTIDDTVNLDYPTQPTRAAFKDMSQVLEIIPSYGVFNFIYTLLKNPSLVKSYSFEEEDIIETGSGPVFRNWNINISKAPGATFGIRETKSFDGNFNFFYKDNMDRLTEEDINLGDVIITSATGQVEYSGRDSFEFGFQYSVLLKSPAPRGRHGYAPFWIRIKWSLQVGTYFYNEELGWIDNPTFHLRYNSVYVTSFNEPLELKVIGDFRDLPDVTVEDFVIEIIQSTELGVDMITYDDFDVMAAIPTVNTPVGTKQRVIVIEPHVPSINNIYYRAYYILAESSEGTSAPNTIRPDDYDGVTNIKAWKLETPNTLDSTNTLKERGVDYNYLDNVIFNILPNGTESPSSITIVRENNKYIKNDFEETYLLNDIDTDNINNSERTYNNFLKRLDGTPTQTWERTYRAGTGKLLDLLSDDVVSQYKNQSYRLTGSFVANVEVTPLSILTEINDEFKKYMFISYELDDRHNFIGFDLMELKNVVTDDGSEDIDAGYTNGFSLGFRS